ncbi:2-dehydropantoate 2-reductase [Paracraurococcus lichenis]|uniref:2-dehydropantoate 2-reductase n=1 Tax=Paracraurococcus lichenis TaxID=3064888 RepID=A0ABT9DUL3_9PROT|nr:2-dehydropantoate 2-reductase [Paracraurococcus sp. LOR1-02]MDO9707591.1 2-dehydropantoate 2-reductase [Paracraurococcus sp. LOR1-02]
MRVTVLGAGAVGGWLAAGLARAGLPVAVLARGATLAALRRDGLVFLEGERREAFPVIASDDPDALPPADILLLGLKSHDLPAALPLVERLLAPQTLVATAQNGLPWWFLQGFGGPAEGLVLDSVDPGGALARALPVRRVLGGVAHVGSRVEAPGVVRLMKQDRMLYGDPSGRNAAALAALVDALQRGGLPAETAPDIRREVWLKLWGNSNMNPLSALSRADMQSMLDDPGVAGLVEAMMREMAAIGARIGLPITQGIPERLVVTRRLGAFRTSMLQDLEAGRRLELGPILGCLVELARHLGEPAPTLAGVHGLVRLLERNLQPSA